MKQTKKCVPFNPKANKPYLESCTVIVKDDELVYGEELPLGSTEEEREQLYKAMDAGKTAVCRVHAEAIILIPMQEEGQEPWQNQQRITDGGCGGIIVKVGDKDDLNYLKQVGNESLNDLRAILTKLGVDLTGMDEVIEWQGF